MKTHLLSLSMLFSILLLNAQNAPVDFEVDGQGAQWTWTVFENDVNPPLLIIANPDVSGINTSATVAQFTALDQGAPFAGCESMHTTDLGIYTLSDANSIVSIMVWKPIVSDVGIKLVTTSGGALPEIKIPNTLTDQWEQITFDFSDYIDNAIYAIEDVDQLVIFPDFTDRNEDRIMYFDNITIGDGTSTEIEEFTSEMISLSPNPAQDFLYNHSDFILNQVRFIDIQGREVMFMNQIAIGDRVDIKHLDQGNYIVRAWTKGTETTFRFVKN